ncbi:Hypothetical protein NTJ_07774 [Nesidiocoris tenuis]|uniref:Uncharacterized protein n=1 Tax=Nesidiocoris tenuis TaxID=355587 RepID=A0ABN7AUH8_9HEMI|nr:Hypothetical protein NTJ_07774 [Nesidiocoris tenuis]
MSQLGGGKSEGNSKENVVRRPQLKKSELTRLESQAIPRMERRHVRHDQLKLESSEKPKTCGAARTPRVFLTSLLNAERCLFSLGDNCETSGT